MSPAALVLLDVDGRKQAPENPKLTWQFASIGIGKSELAEKEPFMIPFRQLTLRPTVLPPEPSTRRSQNSTMFELTGTMLWSRETVFARSSTMRPRWLASSLHGLRSWGRMSAS